MGEYIRGKKAYTRWEAEEEAVDIEYRPEGLPGGQGGRQTPTCLSGPKGRVIQVLLVMVSLCAGLVLGIVVRRSWDGDSGRSGVTASGRDSSGSQPCFHHSSKPVSGFDRDVLRRMQAEIHAAGIKEQLRQVSQEAHVAGTEGGRRLARAIRDRWKEAGLHDARLEPVRVQLSRPSSEKPNTVEIMDSNGTRLFVASQVGDDLLHPDLRPYSGFSPNGTASGKLVYANYGRREDFRVLQSLGVSVTGTVVIVRLGKIHCANKVRNAEGGGAVAVVLYPDPADFALGQPALYPRGLGLPGDAVVRGSVELAPGRGAIPGPPDPLLFQSSDSPSLSVPVQPISYNDARVFLTGMRGPPSPEGWRGALGVPLGLGPGYGVPNDSHVVRLEVLNVQEERKIYHVVAPVRGAVEPNRYILVGCHHDAWSNGSGDPGTGLSVLSEVASSWGRLLASGWRPLRSVIFLSWDAGEYSSLGSAQWVQHHAAELRGRALAYINLDQAVSGNRSLRVSASPLLREALIRAAQVTPSSLADRPESSLYRLWLQDDPQNSRDPSAGPKVHGLGAGSDHVSFQGNQGISSAHLSIVGASSGSGNGQSMGEAYPLQHTAYDNFDAVANFLDPNFLASKTLADFLAALMLLLSDSTHLPLKARDYSSDVRQGYETFVAKHQQLLHHHNISIAYFQDAVMRLELSAQSFQEASNSSWRRRREANEQFLELERAFLLPRGASSGFFQHAIFGASPDDLFSSQHFPGLEKASRECCYVGRERVVREMELVVRALEAGSSVLQSSLMPNSDPEER